MKIQYVIRKSRRRTCSIRIARDGSVIVSAPYSVSEEYVQSFIREKSSWIISHVQKVLAQNAAAESAGLLSDSEIKEIKKRARKIIPVRVKYFADLAGITYGRISIRLQKTRWGSCSADGNLNFNCLLVLMPPKILDSIVVHELCHRLHMDHSAAFYHDVRCLFPSYDECHRWLKLNGLSYLNRVPEKKSNSGL